MRTMGSRAVKGALLAATLVVGAAAPAWASITSPRYGAALRGTATFSASGTGGSGICAYAGDTSSTYLYFEHPDGDVIDSSSSSSGYGNSGAAGTSFTYVTEHQPNGSYQVIDNEYWYSFSSNFFSAGCDLNAHTYYEPVTIDNQSTISYVGPRSAEAGQTVTVAAQVGESGGNGVLPPAGQTVDFTLNGVEVSGTTNSSGLAEAELPVEGTPGSATLTASYPSQYYAASSTAVPFTVEPDPSSTTVTTSPSGSVPYGEAVTLRASVVGAPAANGTPTGTVQFTVDGSAYGQPVSLDNGSASLVVPPSLQAGSHTIGATYSGNVDYTTSSGSTTLSVDPAPTQTTLTATPNPSVYGQPITYTATVASGSGTPVGSVTFTEDGQPLGSPVPVGADGKASASIATLPASGTTYTIEATFRGTDDSQGVPDYASSSASLDQRVDQAATTTSVATSAPSYAVTGQVVQFTAGVQAVPPGAGTPTGTVTFTYEGDNPGSSSYDTTTTLGSATLSGGSATSPSLASLSPGEYTVTATYSGDSDFLGSASTVTQYVFADPTTTVVSSSSDPSVYGQAVTLTATVTPNPPGAGTPTGAVTFSIQSTAAGSTASDLGSVPLTDGTASLVLPTEPVGTYTVTATYLQSGDDFGTSSGTLTQTIDKDHTTTTLVSSANPSVYGQQVTFTAAVAADAPGSGTPTGMVTFFDGSTTLGTANLVATSGGDQATFTTGGLAVATHAISAVYSGDGDFLTSTGDVTQTVDPARTTTTLAQNGQAVQGQQVTFTATVAPVAPGAGVPTGTVTFALNGAPFGSPVPLVGGQDSAHATSAGLSDLTPGDYTVTATYSGDPDFLASSGAIGQAVGQAATTTTLAVSPRPASLGEQVTLTATVTPIAPGSGTPTGTVDFLDGQQLVGSAQLTDGQADLVTSSLPQGTDSLTASYLGDYNDAASQSAAVSETVGPDPTTTGLATAPDPSSFGQPVTLTATVTPTYAVSATPTGAVRFFDGGTEIGTATVVSKAGGDQATLTDAELPVGTDALTATYVGDTGFAGSTSGAVTQTVHQATTTLVAHPMTSSGVVSATLTTPYEPVAGATLRFSEGSSTICTAVTGSDGTGSCTASVTEELAIDVSGSYTVTYAGSADFAAARASGRS